MKTMSYDGVKYRTWKAGLHTHSTVSDGKLTPEQLISGYRTKGYDVLNFSDHRKLNFVAGYDGEGMTLLSGIELHPIFRGGDIDISQWPWHLLAVNVPADYRYDDTVEAQAMLDDVLKTGAAVFVAHPYWCGFDARDVARLHGFHGIEVWNQTCDAIGKADSSECWDTLNRIDKPYPALAVDDIHKPGDLGGGWTWIMAPEASPEALTLALRTGRFYASCGPEFRKLELKDGVVQVECSPCRRIYLVQGVCYGQRRRAEPGEWLEIAEFEVAPQFKGDYCRIVLEDADGRRAWGPPWKL